MVDGNIVVVDTDDEDEGFAIVYSEEDWMRENIELRFMIQSILPHEEESTRFQVFAELVVTVGQLARTLPSTLEMNRFYKKWMG